MSRRFSWPWGRISPEKRMEELDRIISRHQATIRILQAQTKEAIRLHEKSIGALEEQKEIVSSFIAEARRKDMMEEAFEMEANGILVLDGIQEAKNIEEIDEIMKAARKEIVEKSLEESQESPKSDEEEVLDIFEDLDTSIDEIFGKDD